MTGSSGFVTGTLLKQSKWRSLSNAVLISFILRMFEEQMEPWTEGVDIDCSIRIGPLQNGSPVVCGECSGFVSKSGGEISE